MWMGSHLSKGDMLLGVLGGQDRKRRLSLRRWFDGAYLVHIYKAEILGRLYLSSQVLEVAISSTSHQGVEADASNS